MDDFRKFWKRVTPIFFYHTENYKRRVTPFSRLKNFREMRYADFYDDSENVEDELRRFFFTTRKIMTDELRHLYDSGILKASNANL